MGIESRTLTSIILYLSLCILFSPPYSNSLIESSYLPFLLLQCCSLSLSLLLPLPSFLYSGTCLQEGRSVGREGSKFHYMREKPQESGNVVLVLILSTSLPLGRKYSPFLLRVWSLTSHLGFIWELVRSEESQALTQIQ